MIVFQSNLKVTKCIVFQEISWSHLKDTQLIVFHGDYEITLITTFRKK